MNDILVKSARAEDLIGDLEETFATLWRYELKLNPSKCIFGIRSRHFLGYFVIEEENETNLEKIRDLQEMRDP